MKKILIRLSSIYLIFVCFIFVFNIESKVSGQSLDTSNLEFRLTRVIDLGDNKYISIKVSNNSDKTYSFGWVNSCYINVETTEGTFSKNISSGKINNGSNTYNYMIDAPGNIKSIYYTDIRELSNGLPISDGVGSYVSATIAVSVTSYTRYNGINIGITALIVLVALVVLIFFLSKKKGNRVIKIAGKIICVAGIVILIYAGYCFIKKTNMGQADFKDTVRKYGCLFLLGMFTIGIGQVLSKKGKQGRNYSKHKFKNIKTNRPIYNGTRFSNNQKAMSEQEFQRQMDERVRLFNEQMLRDQQEFQRQMEENNRLFNEQTQMDLQESQRQFDQDQQQFNDFNNQQQFNDFNDNNNNNMF